MITLFVPCDSAALAAGADEVVDALHKEATARGTAIDVQRNSSRGMFWLEPLVEVVTAKGRMAYGPVAFEDVPALFDAGFLNGGAHALSLGLTDEIAYLAKQQRLTFARMGITRPLSLDDYAAHGGWAGLQKAVAVDGAEVVQTVLDSGLRGRGGAAFPAGIKWRTVRATSAAQKYVVCNADEGD
jgi:formate dehydrogenase iron-sulfur subunit